MRYLDDSETTWENSQTTFHEVVRGDSSSVSVKSACSHGPGLRVFAKTETLFSVQIAELPKEVHQDW